MRTARRGGLAGRPVLLSFVVAILAGSLVLLTGRAAEAATYGPPVGASVHLEGSSWKPYSAYDCAVNAHYVVTGTNETVSGKVACTGQWNSWLANGVLAANSTGTVVLTFNGTDLVDGNGCFMSASVGYSSDEAGTSKSFGTTLWPEGCAVGQLCVAVVYTNHTAGLPDATEHNDQCVDMAMGNPPGTPVDMSACTQVTPNGTPFYQTSDHYGLWREKFNPGTAYNGSTSQWVPYVVYANLNRGGAASSTGGVPYPGGGLYVTSGADLVDTDGVYASFDMAGATAETTPIGFGVYRVDSAVQPPPVTATPQQATNGAIGVTDPTKCQFYWGQKVADVPNSDIDEPLGALPGQTSTEPTTDPTPPDQGDAGGSGCGFSLTSPSTWASAGMCEAVGLLGSIARLLGKIASAIAGLAADIVGGILGGLDNLLSNLFVPTDAPSFSDVSFSLPSGWLPSFPSVSGGSCGPLSMPSQELGFNGKSYSPRTMVNTCDPPWPIIRTFTYNGTLALALVGIIRLAFRAVLSALGVDVSTGSSGGGGRDDE